MTKKEQEMFDKLIQVTSTLEDENKKFREDMTTLVESINTKTEQKHIPIHFEQDILRASQQAVGESIKSILTGYGSPMTKLVTQVVNEHNDEMKKLITNAFEQVIRTEDFKTSIVNAFSHKVARSIISNNDGLFDKVSNELKQDNVFKAKMTLAVNKIVEECLNNRDGNTE